MQLRCAGLPLNRYDPSPALDSSSEQEETEVASLHRLTRSITSLFISFLNELTLTSADSMSAV